MQGNDLAPYAPIQQAVLFEGVLATYPKGIKSFRTWVASKAKDMPTVLNTMKPNELPLKSLIDSVNRRGIGTLVYTLMPVEAVPEIEHWLIRKGVSTSVEAYPDIETLAQDLRFNRSIHVIYVATQEQQAIIGMRATVLGSERAW